jgi:hypothetical protein
LRDRLAGLVRNGDYILVGSVVKVLVDFAEFGIRVLVL